MDRKLKVLILEDRAEDLEMMLEELRDSGFAPEWHCVASEQAYMESLRAGWDVVLADHSIPQYSSLGALERLRESGLDIPFIIVSGTLDDGAAAECMKRGATDYILKDRMARLGVAIARSLEERRLKEEQRRNQAISSALATVGRRLNTATNRKQAAQIITEVADQLFGWDACLLSLYARESDRLTPILKVDFVNGRRIPAGEAEETFPPGPMARKVLDEGPQLISRKRPASVEGGPVAGDPESPAESGMFVPVHNGETVMGLLCIQSHEPGGYTRENLLTFQALADHCGGALERIRSAEALSKAQERLQRLVAASPVALYSMKIENDAIIATWVGENIEGITGYTPAEACRFGWWTEHLHPGDKHGAISRVHECLQMGHSVCEYRFQNRAGSYVWIRDEKRLMPEMPESPAELAGTWTDITERKQAEQRIQKQAELIDLAPDAIIVQTFDGTIRFWSRGAEVMYGWSAAEALDKNLLELLYRERAERETAAAALKKRGEWFGESHQTTRNGKSIVVDSRWTLLCNERGEGDSILVINTEITERKRLENQLLRAQRLESIGTLAGGIAHDLNNLLAPILIATQIMRMRGRDEEDTQMLARIEASAQRGADVVKQVLTFARGIEGQRVLIQPKYLIKDILKILHETFPKNITVESRTDDAIWLVQGDATQLHQVLLNLCVNARDAMPKGGTLSLNVRNMVLQENFRGVCGEALPGRYVLMEVADTGVGISEEIQMKIFEPFFTTKDPGKGTGLGLSTVLGIVRSHRGFVQVESKEASHTVFKVALPATQAATPQQQKRSRDRLPQGNGELVLVVDDESDIRDVTQKILAKHGYRVLLAANGAEGVARYTESGGRVDLVLTDVMMPLMEGQALVKTLREMNPAIKIIACSGLGSGGANNEKIAEMKIGGVKNFLAKPYSAEDLLVTVDRVLREPK